MESTQFSCATKSKAMFATFLQKYFQEYQLSRVNSASELHTIKPKWIFLRIIKQS